MSDELKLDTFEFVNMDFQQSEEPCWPYEGQTFDVIIAVGMRKTAILVSAPKEVFRVMVDGNNCDDIEEIPIEGLDADEGVYRCKIKFYFHQGYFEGYPAPGESDWGFEVVSTEEIKLNG